MANNEVLRLRSNHGYGTGIGVKFIHDGKNPIDKGLFIRCLLSFSCHVPVVEKVYNCLTYSGEYTCFLQATWFNTRKYDFEVIMIFFGISLDVFFNQEGLSSPILKKNYQELKQKRKGKSVEEIIDEYLLLTEKHYPDLNRKYKDY